MSRKKVKIKDKLLPDIKFNSFILSKFINTIMKNGKKNLAMNIVYKSLKMLGEHLKKNELLLFKEIIDKLKPSIEIKSRKIGGSVYNIPVEIEERRKNMLAIKWIIKFSRKRNEKTMKYKLFSEFNDILNNKGLSIKKRDEIYKIAESNKAFSYYKWNNKK